MTELDAGMKGSGRQTAALSGELKSVRIAVRDRAGL